MKPIIPALVIVFASLVWGCSHDYSPMSVRRLDHALLAPGDSLRDPSMRQAAESYLAIMRMGPLSDSTLAAYAGRSFVSLFQPAVDSMWSIDGKTIQAGLGLIRDRLPAVFPSAKMPRVYGVLTPYNQSVMLSDTILLLGLNHYLGEEYPPYSYFPDYQRRRKRPEMVPVDVAEGMVRTRFPYDAAEEYPAAVSRLLYEGAVVEAVMRLTGLDERTALGYDAEQWKWLEKNEGRMWDALITRDLLFSTSLDTGVRLTAPAPATPLLHPDAPGQAGRFIGHRMVRAYLDSHPEAAPADLMSPKFYDAPSTLQETSYSPRIPAR